MIQNVTSVPHSIQIDKISIYHHGISIDQVLAGQGGYELANINLEFNIFESLHDPFITASLYLYDALGLVTTLPIVGEEIVEMSFHVAHKKLMDKKFKKYFRVVSMTDATFEKSHVTAYILELRTEEEIFDTARKIRKSYSNKLFSEVVKSIFDDYLASRLGQGEIQIEDTKNKKTVVVPNMKPSDAMRFLLASEAQSVKYEPSNFIFYQDRDRFNFKTIENIIEEGKKKTPKAEYTLRDFNDSSDLKKGEDYVPTVLPPEWAKIVSYKFGKIFDKLEETSEGVYESKLLAIDIAKKVVLEKDLKYSDGWDKIQKIDDSDAKTISSDSFWENLTKPSEEWKQEIGEIKNDTTSHVGDANYNHILMAQDRPEETENTQRQEFIKLLRMSVGNLNNTVLTINVPGNLHVSIGDIIKIRFPEFGGTDDIQNKKNRMLAENYLVISIRHLYNKKSGYSLSLELVKNSYNTQIDTLIEQ